MRLRGPQPARLAADPAVRHRTTRRLRRRGGRRRERANRPAGARSTPQPDSTAPTAAAPTAGAAVTPLPVDHDELERLVGGAHHDPHSVLGPHPGATGGQASPSAALRPWATGVAVSSATSATELQHEFDGVWVGVVPGEHVPDYRLEVAYDGADPAHRRPLPVPADAGRDRPAPDRRGPPRAALGGARRAHPRVRRAGRPGQRHVVRRLGAERAGRAGRRRLQLLGRPGAPDALARLQRRLGAVRPRRRRRRALQVRGPRRATACGGRRPTRWRSPTEMPPATASVVYTSTYDWGDDEWMERRAKTDALTQPDEHLRGAPRLVAARGCPTASWPTSWSATWPTSASPTSSSCRSPSTRSAARGATRCRPTSRRRPASAPPTTSATSSTGCTRPASA